MASAKAGHDKMLRRNTAHDLFAQFHCHRAISVRAMSAIKDEDENLDEGENQPSPESEPSFDMFRNVARTGVLYATSRAQRHGFKRLNDPEWANSEFDLLTSISIADYAYFILVLH